MKKLVFLISLAVIIGCASNKKLASNKEVREFQGFTTESFNLKGNIKAFSEQEYTIKDVKGKLELEPTFTHCWYYFNNNKLVKRIEIVDDKKFNSTYGKNKIVKKIEMGKDSVFNTNYYEYDTCGIFTAVKKINKDSVLREVVEIKSSVYDSLNSQYTITKITQNRLHRGMKREERIICDKYGRSLEECHLGVMGAPTFKFIRDKNGLLLKKSGESSFGTDMSTTYSYTHFDKFNNWIQVLQSSNGHSSIKRRIIVYE